MQILTVIATSLCIICSTFHIRSPFTIMYVCCVQSTEPIDLDQFPNAEALQGVGLERLKADLLRRGLKCGGNLQERAQRLFSVKGLRPEDIPAKLLAKGKGQGKSSQK